MDELKKKLSIKKAKHSSKSISDMMDALARSQENVNDIAPYINKPVKNEGTIFSGAAIPVDAFQPRDWQDKVLVPSALETFKNANALEEASDFGLQQLIMDRDEPYVSEPAIVDPSYEGDDLDTDRYGIIKKKKMIQDLKPKVMA